MDTKNSNNEATIYRYTHTNGYEAIGPVLISVEGDTLERTTLRLAGMAEIGGWPEGEYHADLGHSIVPVVMIP